MNHPILKPKRFSTLFNANRLTIIASIFLLYQWWRISEAAPFGGWDARVMWNLRAKLLVSEGLSGYFRAQQHIPHADYPLFLPALIAVIWKLTGITAWVPALLALLFTLGCGILLYLMTQDRYLPLFLVVLPGVWQAGFSQFADMPLAFLILASARCLYKEQWIAAGLLAGFAIHTKNEGLPFALLLLSAFGGRARRAWLSFLPLLLLLIAFKLLVPANDVVNAGRGDALHKLLTPSRWLVVTIGYAIWVLPYALMCGLVAWLYRPSLNPLMLVSLGMLAVYFVIYLITPLDLYYHLRYSLDRLVIQVYPLALLSCSLDSCGTLKT